MGFRIRKSKKTGPLRVNFSKSGIGYSLGSKYARVTHTADGKKRTTYTLPGTGVSWSETNGKTKGRGEMGKSKQKKPGGCLNGVLIILGILIVIGILGGNKSKDPSSDITATTASVTESTTEATEPTETTAQTEATTETATEATTQSVWKYFIANRETMKYHSFSCSYAPDENSECYWLTDSTREDLEAMGYEPCKKCFR